MQCHKCGHVLKFCPHCGHELSPSPEQPEQQDVGHRFFSAASGVIIGTLVASIAYFLSPPILAQLIMPWGMTLSILVGGLIGYKLGSRIDAKQAKDRATKPVSGQSLVEWGLILALVAAIVVAILQMAGVVRLP